jgi:spore germination protein Q
MNGSYYETPVFINDVQRDTGKPIINTTPFTLEESYIENILRNNKGKKVKAHASFSDSVMWRDRVFEGIILNAGRDNLVLYNEEENKHYLILMIYIDFFEFDDEITYAK